MKKIIKIFVVIILICNFSLLNMNYSKAYISENNVYKKAVVVGTLKVYTSENNSSGLSGYVYLGELEVAQEIRIYYDNDYGSSDGYYIDVTQDAEASTRMDFNLCI